MLLLNRQWRIMKQDKTTELRLKFSFSSNRDFSLGINKMNKCNKKKSNFVLELFIKSKLSRVCVSRRKGRPRPRANYLENFPPGMPDVAVITAKLFWNDSNKVVANGFFFPNMSILSTLSIATCRQHKNFKYNTSPNQMNLQICPFSRS